jgi:hypothetical protein
MASKADFYVGRGPRAEWLGSVGWDGLPAGIPDDIREAEAEGSYREAVTKFLKGRGDAVLPEQGWPWPWDDSSGTNYSYAFKRGQVWASCYGSSWWKAERPEPDHTTLRRKVARFPDMALHRKMDTEKGGRKRILVVRE